MDEIDLEGVDPLRRAEVGRRVKIIKSYLALTKPTRTQTAEYAAMVGLGLPQFYRLVRSWRLHRKPQLLAGAGTRGSKRTRRDGLPAETKAIMNAAIEDAAADASEAEIFRSIVERCALAGLEPPSRGAVWTYIMEARSAGITRLAGPRRLLVARCWPKLPTLTGQGPIFPELAVAVLLPDRRILGWDVSCEAGRPARPRRALAQAFAALGRTPYTFEVVLDAGDSADAYDVHLAALGRPPKAAKTSTSQELSRALGWAIGGLRILYKRHTASVGRLLGTSKNQPLASQETERQIASAIEVHNAGLATGSVETIGGAIVPPNVSTPLSAL
ncbi:MAG TPA: hypothetical protein VF548_01480 [Allosphingosinicella sp.]|jgi:hypothetical protein